MATEPKLTQIDFVDVNARGLAIGVVTQIDSETVIVTMTKQLFAVIRSRRSRDFSDLDSYPRFDPLRYQFAELVTAFGNDGAEQLISDAMADLERNVIDRELIATEARRKRYEELKLEFGGP